MKKLFTLFALLACFLGAKADWVEDYKIDYSQKTNFPFYVMGFVPEWVDGVMTDFGANYRYETQANLDDDTKDGKWKDGESSVGTAMAGETEYQKVTGAGPYWHQYFVGDNVPTELDGSYKVTAMIKASEEINLDLQMGWGQWWTGTVVKATAKVGTEWAEVEWEFTGIGGTSCNIDALPGSSTATIEWKWLKVTHNAKAEAPTTWQEWLTNDGKAVVIEKTSADIPTYMGNAEFGAWPDWSLAKNDEGVNINWRGERTGEICAWSIVHGKNVDDDQIIDPVEGGESKSRPFPCDIEVDPENPSNHVFVVHSTAADNAHTDWQAWDNQFWIQSPQGWKEGSQIRIKFRYKAENAANTQTQIHTRYPSKYLHWEGIGDVNFTTQWQEFDKTITFNGSQATGWSVAFNLNVSNKEPNTFYFDDLSWETMVLEEGFFVASSNADKGIEYDFATATQFELIEDEGLYVATVGEKGKQDTWVNEVMISTVRGNDAAFKSNTIKPSGSYFGEDEWGDYAAASLAKIKLPAAGVWQISISPDPDQPQINFVKLEGEAEKEPVDIVMNKEVIVVNAVERQPTAAEQPADEEAGIAAGTGQPWDNQFFIVANRVLDAGEETIVEFDYVADKEAKTTTQCHGNPGDYRGGGIGDVTFTTTEQHYKATFIVPKHDKADIKSIAFNMAEIKDACNYTIKNVQWYLKDDAKNEAGKTMENLINATGTANFMVKVGAGTSPVPTAIETIVNKANTGSAVIYNLAGQRVSKDYKGIVIKNGKKVVVK